MMNTAIGPILLATLLAAAPAFAQDSSNRVNTETDWSVFVEDDPTQCWIVSAPKSIRNTRDGREVAAERGDIRLFVSYWPGDGKKGEVSATGGYPYADGSSVTIQVGDEAFEMFTDGELAWAASPTDDARIVAALKKGSDATVSGQSGRGTRTADTFSLLGFTAAVADAEQRCG